MVLFALAVIFIPMVLDGSGQNELTRIEMEIPSAPKLIFSDELDKLETPPAPEFSAATQAVESSSSSPSLSDDLDVGNDIVPHITTKNKQTSLTGWVVQVGAFSEGCRYLAKEHTLSSRF